MPINRYFKLYLNAGRSIPLVISANQNDKDEQWYFSLFTETGEQYFPDAGAIVGIKCDGKLIDNEATVDSRGYVIVTETAQMTAVPGKNIFELQLNEHTHGTANFIVLVEPSPTNGGVLSDSDLSLFQQAINSIAIAGSGAPAVATLASEMIDTGKIYLYAGSETGYTAGDWYYYNGSAWTDGGKYGGTVDSTLTIPGAAADSAKVGQEISDLKSQIQQGGSFNAGVKAALDQFTASVLQLAEKVAYIDENGQDYYDDIDSAADALHSAMYPPANLSRITAVYTQSGVVYEGDSLDDLKTDLVVTAFYDNGTSAVVSGYTLSGTLAVGTSTITVTYGGKTATFNVTVSASSWDLEWSYTDGDYPYNADSANWTKGQAQGSSFVANEGIRFNASSGTFSTYPKNYETSASSAFEIVCYFNTMPTLNGVILRLGNGTIGMQATIGNGGVSIDNGVSQISGVSISTGVNYTVKATCDTTGTCHLYLDGTEIWSGSPSAIGNKKNYVMMTSTSAMDAYIRSIKFEA